MVAYNYSNISAETTLTSGISPSSTVVALGSASGLPVSYPFTLILDYGQANVEVVSVTALNGTNFTVTRGEDGTAAQSHNPGARVVHGVAARDLKQPQDHIAATTGVHGAAGSVLGTTDVQTLSNKTINGASNTLTVRDADITALAASKLTGNLNGGTQVVSTADATVPLTAKGTATATGNLLELYKGATRQLFVDPAGAVNVAGAAAANLVVAGKVTGDANNRVQIQADGTIKLGPGNAVPDVTISRPTAATLGLNVDLDMGGKSVKSLVAPTAGTDASNKAYVDSRIVVCTSTTRPATPAAGQMILETDTNITRMWTGSAWQMLTPYRQFSSVTAATQANVTFSGIPASIREIRISGRARGDGATNNIDLGWQINGNTAVAYRYAHIFEQNKAAPTDFSNLNSTSGKAGVVAGNTAGANVFGTTEIVLTGCNRGGWVESRCVSGYVDAAGEVITTSISHGPQVASVSSVTILPLTGNFVTGTEFILTGWE